MVIAQVACTEVAPLLASGLLILYIYRECFDWLERTARNC